MPPYTLSFQEPTCSKQSATFVNLPQSQLNVNSKKVIINKKSELIIRGMLMNTVQIECFLTVANYLNFARASEHLNLSQPAVTHQIQSLEAELGVKLFNRSTRKVELTMEGQAFLDDARSIFRISERAKAKFADPDTVEMLTFNIGCNDLAQTILLEPVLSGMRMLFPNIHPSLRQMPRGMVFPKLEDGAIDIALGLREVLAQRKIIAYHELIRTELCCICTNDHPLAKHEAISAEEMDPYKLVLYNPAVLSSEMAVAQVQLSEDRPISDLYYCDHVADALVLVKAGFGISIQPRIFIPKSFGLLVIPIRDMKELSFGVYTKKATGNRILQAFIRLALAEFSKMK